MRITGKVMLTLLGLLLAGPAAGQQAAPGRVEIKGQTIFVLKAGVENFSPHERAQSINRRLETILASPPARLETRVEKTPEGYRILIGSEPIVMVTEADAAQEGSSEQELAKRWAASLRDAMAERLNETSWQATIRRLINAGIIVLLAALALILLTRGKRRLARALEQRRERLKPVHFRGLELLSAESIYRMFARALWLICAAILVLISVAALLLVFAQIPETRGYTYQVFLWLYDPLVSIAKGVVGYLPNLFFILMIAVVTRLALRAVGFIFEQAHRGVISLEPWVHSDVARPTAQIIKAVLIVLALFFIAPLIPGTGSTAARGITVILGLMVSFGSSSTVGNVIAGVVLTYMRPFKIGERVQIGEVSGDVVERTFLYTKIRTIKNEEVIVPSLLALNHHIINYTAESRARGLILHTSVTIGYDAPWRRVHELLLSAAERTAYVLKDPKPFVLQTALSDFFVSYQLNAYTDQSSRMADITSELHQNIQDSFNQGGVEILSPHYFQLRDGNQTTIPPEFRPQALAPRRFHVSTAAERT
jgi:small-conductance mechanosensitive channel